MANFMDRFFRSDEDKEVDRLLGEANEFLSWASQPFFAKFIAWLDESGNSLIDIGSNRDETVKAITRVNTFREIRAHLKRLEERAMAARESMRQE